MALANQAALLDELMGIDRNSKVKREITWEDESVCKYYLAGFCPHDLFVNTKMTLGECPKYHNTKLLDKYKQSPHYLKMGYERRLKKFLENYVLDVQKKIDYNIDRLRNGLLSGTEIAIKERIKRLERQINDTVQTIEEKANEGKIEESSRLSMQLEDLQRDLKYDKIELERQREFSRDKMEDVCKTCGAYISKTDPRNSMENHVTGRIHCSYVKIDEVVKMLKRQLRDVDSGPEYDGEANRHSRSRSSRFEEECFDGFNGQTSKRSRNDYYDDINESRSYRSYGSSGRDSERHRSIKHQKKHKKHKRTDRSPIKRHEFVDDLEDGEYV